MFRHILVAGIGALGSELVKNLGLFECESVYIADPDVLEDKNIARSLLLRDGVAGRAKVTQAIEKLRRIFPRTLWNGAAIEVADVDVDQFERAEVLFSCVDTDLARTEIAALASRYQLPVCDAGMGGTSTGVGRVSWFPHTESAACFACLLSNRRRAELLSQWESNIHACWAETRSEQPAWTSTPVMASIVAGLQAEIALSYIHESAQAFSLRIDLDQAPLLQTIRHSRSIDCPFHQEVAGEIFPLCTVAECSDCGSQFSPGRRVAWVRRRGVCPACGSSALIPLESSNDSLSNALAGCER